MRRHLFIIVCLLLSLTLQAKSTPKQPALTPEREMQWTYWWYQAKEDLENANYARALVLLDMCAQLHPDDARTQEFLGTIYDALKQHDRALPYLEQANRLDPANHWQRYSAALYQQQTEEARKQMLKVAKKAAKMNPKNEDCWDNLRLVASINGRARLAIKAQDRVDQLVGYNAYSAVNRYRLWVSKNKPMKALDELNRYLREDEQNYQILVMKMQLMEAMQVQPTELFSVYEQVLKLDPQNLQVLNNYAYFLAVTGGDLNRAERMSQITIQQQPQNPTYLDTYGWILHLKGQDTLARFYLRQALSYCKEEDQAMIQELTNHLNAIKE